MIWIALVSISLYFQIDAPFKDKDDFEIKFDLSFKQRSGTIDTRIVHLDETHAEKEKRTNTSPLPNLRLGIKILRLQPGEVRLKVLKDDKSSVLNKKIQVGTEFELELGFTDDIKDGISGYKHVIQFLSEKREILSVILIEFDKDGNYFVNGEKRGRV